MMMPMPRTRGNSEPTERLARDGVQQQPKGYDGWDTIARDDYLDTGCAESSRTKHLSTSPTGTEGFAANSQGSA